MDVLRFCLVAGLLATTTRPARSADVTVRVQETDGVYHIHGSFRAAVPTTAAWAVLADYQHIGEFVKSVRASTLVPGSNGTRLLRQDAVAGSFLFHKTIRVELLLSEDPGRRIDFHDVLGRDFQHYVGAWTVRADSAGTAVDYELDAAPLSGVPGLLGRSVMAHSARDLLTEVRGEILRRAATRSSLADSILPR